MPIRKSQKHRYQKPAERKKTRAAILKRAENRCEVCGVLNHEQISRRASDLEHYIYLRDLDSTSVESHPREDGFRDELPPMTCSCDPEETRTWRPAIKVILTVAHLDHQPENNDDDNLKALCQLHHLRHDAAEHGKNAATTRRARGSRNQIDLFGGDDGEG